MENWTKSLVPPFMVIEGRAPAGVHRRATEDGLQLLVGFYPPDPAAAPNELRVFLGQPEHQTPEKRPPLRFPTFEELHEVVNFFLPEGAVAMLPQMISMGFAAELAHPPEATRIEIVIKQLGAVRGSPADRSAGLVLVGGEALHAD